jgi:hypothetical protein
MIMRGSENEAGREVGKRHVCERGGEERRAEVFFFISRGSLTPVAAPNASPNVF